MSPKSWTPYNTYFYAGFPSRKTIYTYSCNLIMKMEIGMLIRNKLFCLTNSTLICVTMMVEFFLNATLEKSTFRSATSNVILDEHRHLQSALQFHNMGNRNIYELCRIGTVTLTCEKCWRPKSFVSSKAFLEPSFNRIFPADILQAMASYKRNT